MALLASVGLRNQMLAVNGFKQIMEAGNHCRLRLYAGEAPSAAGAGLGSATLLLEFTDNGGGGGLVFATAAVSGVLSKDTDQAWKGTVAASGTPAFYRLIAANDTGVASTTAPRLQGGVGLAGADLNLSSLDLVAGVVHTLNDYVVNLPSL